MILLLFLPENGIRHFMQIVSLGDNLHEMSNLFSRKNKKNILVCHLLKILPSVLSVKILSGFEVRLLKPMGPGIANNWCINSNTSRKGLDWPVHQSDQGFLCSVTESTVFIAENDHPDQTAHLQGHLGLHVCKCYNGLFLYSFTATDDNNRFLSNSIDPDEMAHEPSHQDLRCLTFSLSTLHININFFPSNKQ